MIGRATPYASRSAPMRKIAATTRKPCRGTTPVGASVNVVIVGAEHRVRAARQVLTLRWTAERACRGIVDIRIALHCAHRATATTIPCGSAGRGRIALAHARINGRCRTAVSAQTDTMHRPTAARALLVSRGIRHAVAFAQLHRTAPVMPFQCVATCHRDACAPVGTNGAALHVMFARLGTMPQRTVRPARWGTSTTSRTAHEFVLWTRIVTEMPGMHLVSLAVASANAATSGPVPPAGAAPRSMTGCVIVELARSTVRTTIPTAQARRGHFQL